MNYPTQSWSSMIPEASDEGRDLISKLVQYQSCARPSAEQVGFLWSMQACSDPKSGSRTSLFFVIVMRTIVWERSQARLDSMHRTWSVELAGEIENRMSQPEVS